MLLNHKKEVISKERHAMVVIGKVIELKEDSLFHPEQNSRGWW